MAPRLRAQMKWTARIGIVLLVAGFAALAWALDHAFDPDAWLLAKGQVNVGPAWQTFEAEKPMRSKNLFYDLWIGLPSGHGAVAITAEAVLADGRSVPLKCCTYPNERAYGSYVTLEASRSAIAGVAVRAIRIRSDSSLVVREISWKSFPDAP